MKGNEWTMWVNGNWNIKKNLEKLYSLKENLILPVSKTSTDVRVCYNSK